MLKEKMKKNKKKDELSWPVMLLMLGLTLALGLLLRNYVLNTYLVRGDSMRETLHNGEVMFVYRLDYKLGGEIERGDVVTLRVPGDNRDLVKRIIGLPGETVSMEEGRVLINGEEIEEPYLTYRSSDSHPPLTLNEEEYFVLGDNRVNSSDSRLFGPIPRHVIRGQALAVLFPPSRWGASLTGEASEGK